MAKAKGLIILLAILFFSIFIGYFLIRTNPNYPAPKKMEELKTAEIAAPGDSQWINYESPSKNFKVKLPSLPQKTAKTFTEPKTQNKRNYEVYVSEGKDNAVYMINIITFDDIKNAKEDEMLTEVANDLMTTHPDNKLIKTEAGKFMGFPSLKFTLASEKVEIDALTFVNGKTLYVLTRVSPAAASDASQFKYFINSFELTPRR
jgi:hypothetical protein